MFGNKRKPQQRSIDEPRAFGTVIGPGMEFTGEIRGTDDVQVHGRVNGSGELQGQVFVAADGRWQGNIEADTVTIEGQVEGDVHAHSRLDLHAGARVSGDVRCPVIAMAVGATCDGQIHMQAETRLTSFEDRRERVPRAGD